MEKKEKIIFVIKKKKKKNYDIQISHPCQKIARL